MRKNKNINYNRTYNIHRKCFWLSIIPVTLSFAVENWPQGHKLSSTYRNILITWFYLWGVYCICRILKSIHHKMANLPRKNTRLKTTTYNAFQKQHCLIVRSVNQSFEGRVAYNAAIQSAKNELFHLKYCLSLCSLTSFSVCQ